MTTLISFVEKEKTSLLEKITCRNDENAIQWFSLTKQIIESVSQVIQHLQMAEKVREKLS